MIKYFLSRTVMQRGLIGIGFCVILFVFGYFFVLNHMSTLEKPPMGNTIYILLGSTFSLVSVLGMMVIVKYLYDYNKKKKRKERKRKKHKILFLKRSNKEKKIK